MEEKDKKKKKSNKIVSKFDKKQRAESRGLTKILADFLEKAGYDIAPRDFLKKLLVMTIVIVSIATIIVIITGIALQTPIFNIFILVLIISTLVFIGIYLISLLVSLAYLDYKIFQRTQQIDAVLADFLQLTSANISAGMPIDRALWFAVRPRFGVLAKEIEQIAKSTIAGEDLEDALIAFTKKYNSKILKESVNLIIAGLHSGGEIGDLLNKISINIQETKMMKQEIAASVMSYVIFIGAASILAGPALYAMATVLLGVIGQIAGGIDLDTSSGGGIGGGMSFSFSADSISISDFQIFAVVLMIITSFFSASIINIIRKGTIKDGIKNIPIFIAVSMVLYYFAYIILSGLMSGFLG